ncbi:MAG: ribonuclease HI family protein [Patescibacteria group bacterium]|nr:ribonuclease HI family protein [Patescibacteria group bacterium]MDD4304860.1 ribonuclease HI family protein [Patescibacteria group bacterium]MDD4695840.1 ribonuclease HI family protein [Patescibacteria group bacterium]
MYKLFTDGGSRGNPGPAGIGGVLYKDDKIIANFSEYIGNTTNNQAEYRALLTGLELAKKHKLDTLECFLDSELVVKQLKKEYRVKDKDLGVLFVKVWNLSLGFKKITFTHVRREKNQDADMLVNVALDKHCK